LFTIGSGTASQIAVLDLKKRAYRVVENNGKDGRYVLTGHLVYERGATLFAASFDAEKLAVTGSEAPVVEGISFNGPSSSIAEYAFSDSGLLVYIEGTTGQIGGTTMGWADRQGQQQAISDTALWGTGRLSPDGRRIANGIYTNTTTNGSPEDIWVFDTERKIKTRVTFGGVNATPIWTPDGRRITYIATVDGKSGIYWVQADGSGKPEQLLATDSEATPTFPGPGGKERVSTQGGDSVRWARSGRELFYRVVMGEGGVMAVDFQPGPQLHLGLPKALVKGGFGTTFDVAPDGKRFLVELIGGTDPFGRRMVGVDNWFEELRRRAPVKR
jgi:hypothetical protein